MDETRIKQSDLDLLEEINKIKYWRMIRLVKLSIAIGLVLSICYFGWVNYVYANDIRQAKVLYGDDWSCYICGYESMRSCSCIYDRVDITEDFRTDLGNNNVAECEAMNNLPSLDSLDNFTIPLF